MTRYSVSQQQLDQAHCNAGEKAKDRIGGHKGPNRGGGNPYVPSVWCRCDRPWHDEDSCVKCGRWLRSAA